MTATLIECASYRGVITKQFTLERVPVKMQNIILEYNTEQRICQIFLSDLSSHDLVPEMIKILTTDDSFDYDIVMDRLVLGDLIGRNPRMLLDTDDYVNEFDEGPEYESFEEVNYDY
jgi:hypothetical protein